MALVLRSTIRCLNRLGPLAGWQSRTLSDQPIAKPVSNEKPVVNTAPKLSGIPVNVTFITPEGETIKVKGFEGDTVLDIVRNGNLDIDGYGVCDGGVACSTCHVILSPEDYKALDGHPGQEEADMLDLAGHRTDTSRLGCQVILSKKVDGIVFRIPELIRDARGD